MYDVKEKLPIYNRLLARARVNIFNFVSGRRRRRKCNRGREREERTRKKSLEYIHTVHIQCISKTHVVRYCYFFDSDQQ